MILHGLVRTAVYQDLAYAERYLARVTRFAEVEPDPGGAARLTLEAARHIALWMCYQDTIQVALQKTRRARMERVRKEAKAQPNQVLEVHEFLHPQIDEITDTLPTALGATLRRSKSFQRLVHKVTHKGMILNTTSLFGYTLLTTMARCRPLRPRSLRFGREQKAIDAWIDQALAVATTASSRVRSSSASRCSRGTGRPTPTALTALRSSSARRGRSLAPRTPPRASPRCARRRSPTSTARRSTRSWRPSDVAQASAPATPATPASDQRETKASTRDGLPVPPTSLSGATTTSAPVTGSASRLASCVSP